MKYFINLGSIDNVFQKGLKVGIEQSLSCWVPKGKLFVGRETRWLFKSKSYLPWDKIKICNFDWISFRMPNLRIIADFIITTIMNSIYLCSLNSIKCFPAAPLENNPSSLVTTLMSAHSHSTGYMKRNKYETQSKQIWNTYKNKYESHQNQYELHKKYDMFNSEKVNK